MLDAGPAPASYPLGGVAPPGASGAISRARCLLWEAEVIDRGTPHLEWRIRPLDIEAAQRFLPLELDASADYSRAWYQSRLPEDRKRTDQFADQEIRAGRSYRQEFRCIDRYGQVRWLHEDVQIETLASGRWRAVGVCVDITEEKRSEEALRLSQQQHLDLLNGLDAIVWEADAATFQFTFVSQQAEAILGYPAQQWLDDPRFWIDHLHPEDRQSATEFCLAATREGRDHEFEYRMVGADGATVWLRDIVHVVRDGEGRPARLQGVMLNITQRRQAEEALRASELRSRTLLASLPQRVFFKDTNSVFLAVNDRFAADLGLAPEEIIGRTDYDLFPPELADKYQADDRRIIELREPETIEETNVVEGRARIVEVVKAPVLSEEGTVLGVLGLFTDITARKEAEEALRLNEEQLRQSQKMEAVGRLAGGVAHDFNNMLAVINGYSAMLLQTTPPESPYHGGLREIQAAGERAASLTRQLLAYSRKQLLEVRELDVNHVVSGLSDMLRRLIGEDVQLVVSLDRDAGHVRADPSQIEQVLLNLAVNARDAMPEGGVLTIATGGQDVDLRCARAVSPEMSPGAYTLLRVTDSGCGMDSETQSRIFEPFFTTKELGKGTGLGLATVYGIVKQSGGQVEVRSRPGQGTTFTIYLPRVQQLRPAGGAGAADPGRGGQETILLVEDEELVRRLARNILTSHGYSVLEAADGEEALRLAAAHPEPIHLLLTDVVMPRMGGRMLAERLLAERPGLRVVYMSGYTDDAVVRQGVEHQQTTFLEKPFLPAELTRRIREMLDGLSPADSSFVPGS
jgi:two-component system cell cycle sensor histidine kinase/response regulator CckA